MGECSLPGYRRGCVVRSCVCRRDRLLVTPFEAVNFFFVIDDSELPPNFGANPAMRPGYQGLHVTISGHLGAVVGRLFQPRPALCGPVVYFLQQFRSFQKATYLEGTWVSPISLS